MDMSKGRSWAKKGPMDAETANMLLSKMTFDFDEMVAAIESKKTSGKLSISVVAEVSIDRVPYQIQLAFVPKGCDDANWLDPSLITYK